MPDRSIKAIFFDIDDTLFSTTEFAEKARMESIAQMIRFGLNVSEKDALYELKEVINEFTTNYQHHFDKLLIRLPESAYEGINPAILVAAGVVGYHQTKFRELKPYPDVKDVLEKLSDSPLILGIISAGLAVKQAEKLVRLDLYKYLDPQAIFISEQIGISKPNIKLYQRACDILNLDPPEVMYIGDNPAADIDPTNQLGMITVRNRRATQHGFAEGKTKPDYEIHDFYDLLAILRRDFGMAVDRG
ncbi:MAG: TIGR02253 family HAD-type hydrolase [Planctomycetota bacterium]|jgi:putative hydrolase of the HAD superfamily